MGWRDMSGSNLIDRVSIESYGRPTRRVIEAGAHGLVTIDQRATADGSCGHLGLARCVGQALTVVGAST
jgi:hypothetical protein